jgi:hypothetical protein
MNTRPEMVLGTTRDIMKTQIENAAAVLIGKSMWKCTRAADLASFQFGSRSKVPGFRNTIKEVGEFALHVQCAWRIAREDRVIVGSRDLYYPADSSGDEEIPPEFDWDRDPNLRDKQVQSLFADDTVEFTVLSVEAGAAGSLSISLSGNLFLHIFPYDSLSHEHWRLFDPRTDSPHFVVTGSGIEA